MQLPNFTKFHNGIRVRVMCPVCHAAGAQYIHANQPFCHKCETPTLMLPANNTGIVITWEDFVEYCKGEGHAR